MAVTGEILKKLKALLSAIIIPCLSVLIISSYTMASDFIDIALFTIENSPELNIALEEVEFSRADEKVSLSTYLPQLSGKIEGGTAREEYQDELNTYGDVSASLALSQALVDLAKFYAIKEAGTMIDVAELKLVQTKQDIILEFSNNWGAYWKALRQIEVNKINIQILFSSLDGTKTRYDAGELTLTDLRLAESRYQTSLSQKIRFLRELRRAKEALEERIGDAPPGDVELFKIDIARIEFPEITVSVNEHPSMVPLVKELSALKMNIDQKKAGHLPTLDIVGRYKYQERGEEESFRYSFDEYFIGLELNIPIYTGGAIYNATKKSVSKKNQLVYRIVELKRELNRDIETAKFDYDQSKEEYLILSLLGSP